MKSLLYKPAWELAELIRNKDLSPVELMKKTPARVEVVNPVINAFVELRADQAWQKQEELKCKLWAWF